MSHTFTLWLGRFFSGAARSIRISEPSDPKPVLIEVEALPDYLWRELGFQQPRRRVE